ncbi:MAG: lipid-binding SYLF domain-containing protein [Thermoanaerobaculia bacterium]
MKKVLYLLLAGLMVLAIGACANNGENDEANNTAMDTATETAPTATTATTDTEAANDAVQLVNDAQGVAQQMSADQNLVSLLKKAKGVYIVPHYGKGALVVGGQGGTGVMLANQNGQWSNPVFFDMGGISIGAQAGGEGGEIAMLLMTDKAVNAFKGENTFSLNADAGFTIVNYSAKAQGDLGKGDVIMWSSTSGAFAGAQVGATDINFDDNRNNSYYGAQNTNTQQILQGQVTAPPTADQLKQSLSGGSRTAAAA